MLGIKGWRHSNWAETYSSRPSLYLQPQCVEDVKRICKDARSNGETIVVVGAGHSPSTLTMTRSWLLNLDHMNRIIGLDEYKAYTDVEVEAGIRLRDLNEELAGRRLALQNLGSISDQSVAGVISTGTHGSSAFHGLVSDQIVQLVVVNGNGEEVTCSDSQNPELFKAALLSLGAFGVIVRATIRCVPEFRLKSRQIVVDFDDFLESRRFDDFFTAHEFHRIWWYPYTSKLVIWGADRTQEVDTPPAYSFYSTWLGRFLYESLLWLAANVRPSWTPFVEKWLFYHQFDINQETIQVSRSDKAINFDCLFHQFVNEWAFPLSNGREVLRKLRDEINSHKFYVHAPIEIRASNTTPHPAENMISYPRGAVHGNNSRPYLDPSPQLPWAEPKKVGVKQLTLNINATVYRPFGSNPSHSLWFEVFEHICLQAGGRPHWAKNFITREIPDLYGENLVKWQRQKARFDPNGIFGNSSWLKEHHLT